MEEFDLLEQIEIAKNLIQKGNLRLKQRVKLIRRLKAMENYRDKLIKEYEQEKSQELP